MDLPSFSVILPTYNRAFIIKTAINSVLKQSYDKFELIIVDDGSTDFTEQIVKSRYKSQFETGKIRYIKCQHKGVCAARNVGLDAAKNDWITYIDSDNMLFEEALGVFSVFIRNNPNAKNFYGSMVSMTNKKVYGKEFSYEQLKENNFIDLGTYVHHKSLIAECGKFDENLKKYVDWDLILRQCYMHEPIFVKTSVLYYNDTLEFKRITTSERNAENFKKVKSNIVKFEQNHAIHKKPSMKKELPMISKVKTDLTCNANLSSQITIAMATHPKRENSYVDTVWQLLPYCDKFCICFNGYDSLPKNLPKSNKIIAICANGKNGIKDLGCNNKMYWLGDFPGYYATVDDDIIYPKNYIAELKKKVDLYQRKAICSFHGHIYNDIYNGRIHFNNRQVFPFHSLHTTDVYCHRVGMGVAMCYPSEIGISKEMFLTAEKNSGDDEITAIWAQKHEIPLVCISTAETKILENTNANVNAGLYYNKASMQKRKQYLESYKYWKMNTLNTQSPFFRIIIPTYNSEKFLDRCINSIVTQTFKNYKIVVVDDMSTDKTKDIIRSLAKKHKEIAYEFLTKKKYGGGARNAALKYSQNSTYTIFLDSDDYYSSSLSLQHLHDVIVKNNYPDLVKCAYQQISKNSKITYKFRGKTFADIVHLCSPGTSCIKSKLCPDFMENRIRFNDVIWSLRAYDRSKTLAIMEEPLFIYTIGDNPNSCQHAEIDQKRINAIFQLIDDLKAEIFSTSYVNVQKQKIIADKEKLIVQQHYKYIQ